MKQKIGELKKSAGDIRDKAGKAASTVKQVVQVGVDAGRGAIEKAGEMVNRDRLGKGIEATSKGVGAVAHGAKVASKSVGKLAEKIDGASHKLKKWGNKLKKSDTGNDPHGGGSSQQ